MKTLTSDILKSVYMKRSNWSHKGNFGHLAVIGGSKRFSGAPALAALAALKTGADLVTVIAPQRASDIIAAFSPNIITYPLRGDYITKANLKEALNITKRTDAILIGSGIERNTQTLDFILKFLEKTRLPCVIDADGLHAFFKNTHLLKPNYIITPHSYEFEMLFGRVPENSGETRGKLAEGFSKTFKSTILLKGHIDVISNGKETAINKTGSPYMTVGGTGDTLAGICGALLVMGNKQFNAACASAYINGEAGSLAAKEFGASLTATDVINNIHKVLE